MCQLAAFDDPESELASRRFPNAVRRAGGMLYAMRHGLCDRSYRTRLLRTANADAFKHRRMLVGGELFQVRLDFGNEPRDVIRRNQFPIHLNPFTKRNQMWRREQSHPQSCRAINAFQHRACRAFAVRARDVDEAQFVLRITGESRESARRFQTWTRTKDLQAVKKLDGDGVGHKFPT